MQILFSPDQNKSSGVLAYINTNFRSNFSNYIDFVPSVNIRPDHQNIHDILPPTGTNRVVIYQDQGSYTFTFKTFSMNVTSYYLKSSSDPKRIIKHWTLEARKDDSDWEIVDEVNENEQININRNINNRVYNSFKLTKLNINDDGDSYLYYFDLYGFDLFGTISAPFDRAFFVQKLCTSKERTHFLSLFIISLPLLK